MASLRVVAESHNSKLGPGWSSTYREVGPTCPNDCPLLGSGCYAQRGRVGIHQANTPHDVAAIKHKLDGAPRVRWDVSGDNLNESGRVDKRYLNAKYAWHERNPDGVSLGYTHAPMKLQRAGYGPETHPDGFNLLASCHDIDEARELRDGYGWRTARVVSDRSAERDECERLCPYDLQKHLGKAPTTNCSKCGLCWGSQHQDKSIVFIQF